MLDTSKRIWLKDGSFVQLFNEEEDFAEMLEDKLGAETAVAFRDIVALAEARGYDGGYDDGISCAYEE